MGGVKGRYTCYQMYKATATGISGENMLMTQEKPVVAGSSSNYILRPEAMESIYYLYQITGDPVFR